MAVSKHAIMVIGMQVGGVTHMNNAGMKCKQGTTMPTSATEEKIKSCTSGSGIVRTRPPRDEAIIKVGIVCTRVWPHGAQPSAHHGGPPGPLVMSQGAMQLIITHRSRGETIRRLRIGP